MLSVNWSQIIAIVLLVLGGSGTAIIAVYMAYQWLKTRKAAKPTVVPSPVTPDKGVAGDTAVRGADDPAPTGAVDWIKDIKSAMGGSSPESILAALLAGETRDQARYRRIKELEQAVKPNAVVPAKETEVKS